MNPDRQLKEIFSNPHRLAIVKSLKGGSKTLKELRIELGITKQLLGWHIVGLEALGVIEVKRHGIHRRASLSKEKITQLLRYLKGVLNDS